MYQSFEKPHSKGSLPPARSTSGPVVEEELVTGEELPHHPNWLPGLPLPPPDTRVEPPRNRSKSARTRYLSQLQSYNHRR